MIFNFEKRFGWFTTKPRPVVALRECCATTGRGFVTLAITAFAAAHAEAQIGLEDLQIWAGSGDNEAAVVIDWNDGRDPLAWGYRWDGDATGEDMILAVIRADPRLTGTFNNFGSAENPDLFVDTFGYDRDDDGSFAGPDDSFARSGDFITDFRFWEYFNAPDSPYTAADGSGDWVSASVGLSTRSLTDGAWDGFRFDDAFPGPNPRVPVAAVPEPTAAAVLAFAAAGWMLRRRPLQRPARGGNFGRGNGR